MVDILLLDCLNVKALVVYWLELLEMDTATWVQILNVAVCIFI